MSEAIVKRILYRPETRDYTHYDTFIYIQEMREVTVYLILQRISVFIESQQKKHCS